MWFFSLLVEILYLETMRISTMSNYHSINLIGCYHSMDQKDLIDPEIFKKGYSKEIIAELTQRVKTSYDLTLESCGFVFTGDLKRFTIHNIGYWLSLYMAYKDHGLLPFPGTITEQPNKVMEIFSIFAQLFYEKQDQQQKQMQAELKKNGR